VTHISRAVLLDFEHYQIFKWQDNIMHLWRNFKLRYGVRPCKTGSSLTHLLCGLPNRSLVGPFGSWACGFAHSAHGYFCHCLACSKFQVYKIDCCCLNCAFKHAVPSLSAVSKYHYESNMHLHIHIQKNLSNGQYSSLSAI
jgi:hypothetical protein